MPVHLLLENAPLIWIGLATTLGLLVGSFLNVVIGRLPDRLNHSWKQNCQEYLELTSQNTIAAPPGIIHPASRCPKCKESISALDNIPVISYVLLKGRCRHCKTSISLRYPAIELLTAILSGVVAWQLGYGLESAAAILLTWVFITLSFIDFDHQILPDIIVLPVLWLGLLFSLFLDFSDPESSIIGALTGYLSLWSVFQLFKLLTGKEGMGYGDFKLLALIGAWLGWQVLPGTILLSSLVGAVIGLTIILVGLGKKDIPIPFGPYLATAGWIMMIWGQDINQWYLRLSGL